MEVIGGGACIYQIDHSKSVPMPGNYGPIVE